MSKNEFDSLAVRTEDMCRRCERMLMPLFTGFLSPEEQVTVRTAAEKYGGVFCVEYGGFEGAERRMTGIFPSDIYAFPEDPAEEQTFWEMFDIEYIRIAGSGFVNIGHRDVLGSLMSLGIKRATMGDILIGEDKKSAYTAVSAEIAEYIVANLERVARDKVRVCRIERQEVPEKKQEFADLSLTLASIRLDALCSGFLNISRDKAKKLIASGKVSINHAECTAVDRSLSEGDIVTVKGAGKFKIDAFLGMTAKDRYRVIVRKYL